MAQLLLCVTRRLHWKIASWRRNRADFADLMQRYGQVCQELVETEQIVCQLRTERRAYLEAWEEMMASGSDSTLSNFDLTRDPLA